MNDHGRKLSSEATSREKLHTLESSCSSNLDSKHEPKAEEEQKEDALFSSWPPPTRRSVLRGRLGDVSGPEERC